MLMAVAVTGTLVRHESNGGAGAFSRIREVWASHRGEGKAFTAAAPHDVRISGVRTVEYCVTTGCYHSRGGLLHVL